jgi:hypothetical protein
MKISEKFRVLGELGILDWINKNEDEESLRVIINSLAQHYFEEQSIYDFAPASEWEGIHDHFTTSGYDIDWYEMVTFNFSKDIKEDCSHAVHCINYEFIMPNDELELCIRDWVQEWSFICKKAFVTEISR